MIHWTYFRNNKIECILLLTKIILRKTTSAIFLAIVLIVAGTFAAISPSFIIGVNAQSNPYYGMDNNYKNNYGKDSYKSKDNNNVIVKKIKCNNINANLNGISVDIGTTNGNNPLNGPIAEAQELELDEAQTSNSFNKVGERDYDGIDKQSNSNQDFKFVCINNYNIKVDTGNETTTSVPPELATTLSVSLAIKCTPDDTNPRSAQACNRITTEILSNLYNIEIIGNNPNPNSFTGSPVPVIVTLGPDSFLVEVTDSTQVIEAIIDNIQSDLNVNIFGPTEHFIGHYPLGEIFAGESLTCNIEERLTVASN